MNRKRKGPLWKGKYSHGDCEDRSDSATGSGGRGSKDDSGMKVGRAQAAELRREVGTSGAVAGLSGGVGAFNYLFSGRIGEKGEEAGKGAGGLQHSFQQVARSAVV